MKNIKVAVIEDTENISNVLSFHLKKRGYIVFTALNGEDGTNIIKKEFPDIILLDITMPKKDGYEVLSDISEIESYTPIVIIISAKTQTEDIIKGFNLGAIEYVTKPFKIHELLQRVEAISKVKLIEKQLMKKNL